MRVSLGLLKLLDSLADLAQSKVKLRQLETNSQIGWKPLDAFAAFFQLVSLLFRLELRGFLSVLRRIGIQLRELVFVFPHARIGNGAIQGSIGADIRCFDALVVR